MYPHLAGSSTRYRLFWTGRADNATASTDFKREPILTRLRAWLGWRRPTVHRGVAVWSSYNVDAAYEDGHSYTVLRLRTPNCTTAIGVHPSGLTIEEAIDRILDGDDSVSSTLRERILYKQTETADGAPWELHRIQDPIAREAAVQAFKAAR